MARILLAEADNKIREFIAGILVEFGHEVAACADASEASARLKAEPIDLMLTDLVLTGSDGASLGRNWAALGIPTITLSGREFRAEQPPQNRPLPLLEKPFRFADLRCVLDAVSDCARSAAALDPFARNAA